VGAMSWMHWALVILVVVVLFGGRGKLSGLMGDAAKGIRAFKDGDGPAEGVSSLPRTDAEKDQLNR